LTCLHARCRAILTDRVPVTAPGTGPAQYHRCVFFCRLLSDQAYHLHPVPATYLCRFLSL